MIRRTPKSRREPFVPPAEHEGYRGPATLVVDAAEPAPELSVEVDLMDHFEPLDGRTHWYGRIRGLPELTALKEAGATSGELVVGDFAATVRLAEFDAWGNVAVTGVGVPPYAPAAPS